MSAIGQTAFYVYRNDGDFNVFYFEQVDSMLCSKTDADGMEYPDFVTQKIFTPDSTYIIPLSAIDSIGFVTPSTIYKDEVIQLSKEFISYVKSYDNEMTFVVEDNIPKELLPNIGDKIVINEYTELFPGGFVGAVQTIDYDSNGIAIECDRVKLEDVFVRFYGLSADLPSHRELYPSRATMESTFNREFNLPNISLIQNDNILDIVHENEYALEISSNLSAWLHPVFHAVGHVIITPETGVQIGISLIGDYYFEENLGFSGQLKWETKIGRQIDLPPLAVAPYLIFYFEPGFFINADVEAAWNMQFTQHYRSVTSFQCNNKVESSIPPVFKVFPVGNTYDGSFTFNGSYALGGYFDVGVKCIHESFSKLGIHGELGIRFNGSNVLYKSDVSTAAQSTSLYDRFKATGYKLESYYGFNGFLTAGPFEFKAQSIGNTKPIAEIYHVPVFSNGTCSDIDGILHMNLSVSGEVFRPVDVGFVVFDDSDREIGRVYAENKYEGNSTSITCKLKTPVNSSYVRPIVNALGIDGMLASPKIDIQKETYSLTGTWKPVSDLSYYKLTFFRDGTYIGADLDTGEVNEEGTYEYDGKYLVYNDQYEDSCRIKFLSPNRMVITYINDNFAVIYERVTTPSIVGMWDPFSTSGYLEDFYRMIFFEDGTYEGRIRPSNQLDKWGTYICGDGYLTLRYTDGSYWDSGAMKISFSADGRILYGSDGEDWAIYQYVGPPPVKNVSGAMKIEHPAIMEKTQSNRSSSPIKNNRK